MSYWLALALAAAVQTPSGPAGKAWTRGPVVVLDTSLGKIRIGLDKEKAPISTQNFVDYVQAGYYDGTIFHRVIADFMIQGGGYDTELKKKDTRPPIKLEAGKGLHNTRGTIAMARTNDPNSATSQFFINVVDNSDKLDLLNGGYAVFGEVLEGLDVADKIRAVPKVNKGGAFNDLPATPVVIKSARLEGAAPAAKPAPAKPAPTKPASPNP
jgi:peptidyl-prolyl cis-trans isomerase A (cyclophilin A)